MQITVEVSMRHLVTARKIKIKLVRHNTVIADITIL